MAVGGVLATQLTTPTARSFGIFLDGFDVSEEPRAAGSRYGVPRDSIEVTETGRWGVSSMTFDIDDTALLVGIQDGMEVRFEIFPSGGVAGIYFRGWVSRYTLKPAFGEQGRTIAVEATGVEALLDWALIPADVTYAAASSLGAGIQSLVAAAVGIGPLFAIGGAAGQSTTDQGMTQYVSSTLNLVDAVTITGGTSLGEAIRQLCASSNYAATANLIVATVDFNFSLRVYELIQTAGVISQRRNDASLVTIVDTPAGTPGGIAEGMTLDVTAAANRGVFIQGLNAAGTGTRMDGTGKVGPIAYVSDDTSDSAASLATIGADYLARATTGLNGHFAMTNLIPLSYVMPDGTATITDPRMNLVAQQYYIGPITRHFPGANLIDLDVSFGGPPPSGSALLRQLTRDQRL